MVIFTNNISAAPASQEDREYLEKVKSLEKYIEPLRNMIAKIGNENDQDRLTKMKKLLDILSNPGRRMPISTLQKCEDVLKRMALEPDRDPNSQGTRFYVGDFTEKNSLKQFSLLQLCCH